MLLTNNKKIAQKVYRYRNHGLISRDNVEDFGVNSRLDIIHSEILKFRLNKLEWVIKQRTKSL